MLCNITYALFVITQTRASVMCVSFITGIHKVTSHGWLGASNHRQHYILFHTLLWPKIKKTLKLWIAGAFWNQWSPVDSPHKILVMWITTITLRCLVLCGRCLFYPIRVRFVMSHYKKIGIDRISTSHENGATPGYILFSIGGNKFTLIPEQNGRQFADDTLGLFIPLKQKSINIKNHVFPLIRRFYFNCI